jgi:hypothetical protein
MRWTCGGTHLVSGIKYQTKGAAQKKMDPKMK